jgi:radical SAM superfamily enzyme YgiQ (UPF0313 family)
MKVLLAGIYPQSKIGLAPFYLKSYCGKSSFVKNHTTIDIEGFTVNTDNDCIISEILQMNPDIIGFSCYVWGVNKILKLSKVLKESLPRLKIILGGPEVSFTAKAVLENNKAVDIIVKGEGEVTFLELTEYFLGERKSLGEIKGIVFREKHRVMENNVRPVIGDLDEIPSPFLNGTMDLNTIGNNLYAFETYRGCPFNCNYCSWGKVRGIRYFSLERINKDLAAIMQSSIRRVWISDAVCNFKRDRFKDILRFIINNNVNKVIFDFEMRAELLDRETIFLLGKLHDGYIDFGLQSINRKALKACRREWNKEKFERNIELLRKTTNKIKIYIDVIYGLPNDTLEAHEETISYALSLKPYKIQHFAFQVLPGSHFFNNPAEYRIVFDERAPHLVRETNTFTGEDMEKAKKWNMYLRFYLNPAVHSTIILLNGLTGTSHFELFKELLNFLRRRLKLTRVIEDFNIEERYMLKLNKYLEAFTKLKLNGNADRERVIPPFLDFIRLQGYRSICNSISSRKADTASEHMKYSSPLTVDSTIKLSPKVKIVAFDHDVRGIYDKNILEPENGIFDLKNNPSYILFNYLTNEIINISTDLNDLLEECESARSARDVIERFAEKKGFKHAHVLIPKCMRILNEARNKEFFTVTR